MSDKAVKEETKDRNVEKDAGVEEESSRESEREESVEVHSTVDNMDKKTTLRPKDVSSADDSDGEISFRPKTRGKLSQLNADQVFALEMEKLKLERLRVENIIHQQEMENAEAQRRRNHEMEMAGKESQVLSELSFLSPNSSLSIKVPKYEGEHIDGYLEQFEKIANTCKWPKDTWVLRLAPKLTGLARKAYNQLETGNETDYEKLKRAILDKYELNAEAYRRKFRSSVKGDTQSVKEWVGDLNYLFRKWMGMCDVSIQTEETNVLMAQMVIDQVYAKLPREMGIYLKEKDPKDTDSLGKLADSNHTIWCNFRHHVVHIHIK